MASDRPSSENRQPPLPDNAFRVEVPIRFSHSDPAGIVYFPNYFDMMNGLVEDWFYRRLKLDYADLLLTHRRGLPTVHAECDFVGPSRMGEMLTLGLTVERIGTSSITLQIVGYRKDETRLRATLVLVSTSLETNRAIPIPEDLRRALEAYSSECRP